MANISFNSYLMYRPTYGAWVALAECDWSWSGSATNIGTAAAPVWPPNTAAAARPPVISTPGGSDAFPEWTYDTSELTFQPGL